MTESHENEPSADNLEQVHGEVISLPEATRTWIAISLQTFGGPAGQIAVMQHRLVDEKRWIGQQRFLHALSFCTLLPGPEAQQLSIYIGWLLNGVRGGLIAGTLFVLPGVVTLLGLSAIFVGAGDTTVVTAVLAGLAPAVLAIVVQAVFRLGGRALGHPALVTLAIAAFVALSVFAVPFPVVVAAAAVIGWALGRWAPKTMDEPNEAETGDSGPPPVISDDALQTVAPSGRHALKVVIIGLVAWAVPVGAVVALTGRDSIFTDQALFFTGTALVTFGGAYAVLAYVAHQAVQVFGWLTPGEMITGLALAETTPGPLIMVVQFVAFVGAYRDPGDLNPWVAAVLASLLTTWVTFVPCFVFVFVGAPYVERLRGNKPLSAALTGIMAAVVGVIANLAIFFAIHTLFTDVAIRTWGPIHLQVPDPSTAKPLAMAIAMFAALLLFRQKLSVLRTLGACALIGLGAGLIEALVN
ncbi:MAG: chromate transporter [Nocardioidaceae bacterium]|nr:chromate transporter [Nocardioidaceae bacterium]